MKKRYYQVDERVWIIAEKTDGIVKDIDIPNVEMTVEYKDERGEWQETTRKFWEFDKYRIGEVDNEKVNHSDKLTYFASVKGGHVPTKDEENAGYDCYVRESWMKEHPKYKESDGESYIWLKKMEVAKVPLGFASYLNKEDLLYIGMERSSVGAVGIMLLSGLIDSTYQGEVILQMMPLYKDVVLTTEGSEVKEFEDHIIFPISKALAQAVVIRQSDYKTKEIPYEELLNKPSTRGTQGWGSTDTK